MCKFKKLIAKAGKSKLGFYPEANRLLSVMLSRRTPKMQISEIWESSRFLVLLLSTRGSEKWIGLDPGLVISKANGFAEVIHSGSGVRALLGAWNCDPIGKLYWLDLYVDEIAATLFKCYRLAKLERTRLEVEKYRLAIAKFEEETS